MFLSFYCIKQNYFLNSILLFIYVLIFLFLKKSSEGNRLSHIKREIPELTWFCTMFNYLNEISCFSNSQIQRFLYISQILNQIVSWIKQPNLHSHRILFFLFNKVQNQYSRKKENSTKLFDWVTRGRKYSRHNKHDSFDYDAHFTKRWKNSCFLVRFIF